MYCSLCSAERIVPLTALLLVLGVAVPAAAQIRQTTVRFDHLGVADGLSDESVNALVQDAQGFLWIGTNDGLNRYDGYGFTVFTYDPADPNSLHDTTINEITLAADGGLWLGTFSGVERYDPLSGAFTRYADDSGAPGRLPADQYYEVLEDRQGVVWAGSDQHGLFRIDPATGAVTAFPADPDDPARLLHPTVVEIFEARDGTLWVATGRNGLHRFDPATESFTRVPVTEPGLAETDGFIHIEEDGDGRLWLGGWGLYRFDPATGEAVRYLPQPDLPAPAPPRYDNYISSLAWDAQGHLWVGTSANGLYRFDPATAAFMHFPPDPDDPTSLPDEEVNELLLDRSGVLWVGTVAYGLSRLDPRREHVTRLSAPTLEGLHALQEDDDGHLWFVFADVLVRWDPAAERSTSYRHQRGSGGIVDSYIWELYRVPSMPEVLWLGTNDGALHRMDASGRVSARYPLVARPDFEAHPVFDVAEVPAQPGVLWVAVLNGGLCRLDAATGARACITPGEGSLADIPRHLAADRTGPGILWVGSEGGLLRFDTATETFTHHYRHDPADTTSLSIDFNASLYASRAEPGVLWIGTWTGGLNRFDTRTGRVTRRYTDRNSDLPHNTVYDVLEDTNGILWICTARGVARLDPQTGVLRDYSTMLGLPRQNTTGLVSRTGELLISVSREAVYRFDPNDLEPNTHAPEVVLTDLYLRDAVVRPGPESPLQHPLAYTETVTLAYAQRDVAFDYVALDYLNPEGIRYAYRLDGYDADWHDAGARRRATYTNLPPGDYTFRVRAANADGVRNEDGASVRLTIRPPWWRSVWAYLAYGLLFVAAVIAVDRVQRRRLLAREREKARERELEQARAIERAYTELKTAKDRLVQQEKMASLGQLTAGIAHEIKNPLNFVNNFSEIVAELSDELNALLTPHLEATLRDEADDFRNILADLGVNAEQIHKHGRRADAIVKSMMAHAREGSGVQERVDLNALVEEHVDLAYHGKRAQMPDFNCTIEKVLGADVGRVAVVPQDIGRVVLNLVGNAFDAVSEGREEGREKREEGDASGTGRGVQRNAPPTSEPTVTVTTRRLADAVEIRIADNGPGIPKDFLPKIFEPFFTTKPAGSGTGLGLSLSYDIVTQGHGGTLTVESEPGEGATFIVTLPA